MEDIISTKNSDNIIKSVRLDTEGSINSSQYHKQLIKGFGEASYSKSVKAEVIPSKVKRSYNDTTIEELDASTSCCCFGVSKSK